MHTNQGRTLAKICFEYLHCLPNQLARQPRDQVAFAEAAVGVEMADLERVQFEARAQKKQ